MPLANIYKIIHRMMLCEHFLYIILVSLQNTLAARENGQPCSSVCPLKKVTLFTLLKAAGEEIPAIIRSQF